MFIPKCVLLSGLILTLVLDPITGKRSFGGRHSYPKSGGLSGGGHSGGGLSGGGHGYPSNSGGSHGYPSNSGGNHGYPSGGLSGGGHGYPQSGGTHSHPQSGHSYPPSGQSGGSHSYPSQNKHGYPASPGLSGGGHGYPNKPIHTYNNYHYSPPTQISYAPTRGSPPVSYPVYHGEPPKYVYQYKDSGSKYGTLLAGLALMNLGTLGVAAYAAHKSSQNGGSGSGYRPQPNEVCKFAIKKENGDYEETKIDCQIISSFILQDMEASRTGTNNTITTTTTVTNVTTVNHTIDESDQSSTVAPGTNVLYVMQPNGTLVPVNVTGVNIPNLPGTEVNATHNETTPNSENKSITTVITNVTTTTTNTNLPSALDVKGKPVEVTPGMQCFVMRHSPTSNMRKTVPCGLLQTYAEKSIQRNSASHNVPVFTIVAAIMVYCVA